MYDVNKLRDKYRIGPMGEGECDVGGALCIEMTPPEKLFSILDWVSYPSPKVLAEFLAIANTACGENMLINYAREICSFCDDGNFDEAWNSLEAVLAEK